MHAEARIAPIVLTFPPEVIESVVVYTNDRSVEPATLIPLAINAPRRSELFATGKRMCQEPSVLDY